MSSDARKHIASGCFVEAPKGLVMVAKPNPVHTARREIPELMGLSLALQAPRVAEKIRERVVLLNMDSM